MTVTGEIEADEEAVTTVPPQGLIDKWLVIKSDDVEYKLPLAQSSAVAIPVSFVDYVPADYNEVQGFRPSPETFNFANKNYFYNSTLATNTSSSLYNVGVTNVAGRDASTIVPWTTLFPPFYYPRPAQLSVDQGGQVPGPFPYGPVVAADQYPPSSGAVPPPLAPADNSGQWGWSQWGGDTVLDFGPHLYSVIITHFGHGHILTLHNKIQAIRANTNANVTYQDMVLQHFLAGSTLIFARFALLINYTDCSPIAHTGSNLAADIAQSFTLLIYGTPVVGDVDGPGIVDVDFFLSTMNFWATDPAYGNGDATLTGLVTQLQTQWNYLLRRGLAGVTPIDLMAWYQLLGMHQKDMYDQYVAYRFYYSDPTSVMAQQHVNHTVLHGTNGGNQLAAFFVGFYTVVNFIDRLVTVLGNGTPTAIPNATQRMQYCIWNQTRYWKEHVTMFNDYGKAAARQDDTKLFDITMQMLESCSSVGVVTGEIFRAFDQLVRSRDMWTTLTATPGPHAPGFPF